MRYYLSLGSNVGNREQTLREALQYIGQRIGRVDRCSSFFYSEAWGFESENGFCNLCCVVDTKLEPLEVLRITQDIERELGRTHKSDPAHPDYQDRTIDIDLIRVFDEAGEEILMSGSELTLPHPLWEKREFVKVPLEEIKG